MEYIDQVGDYSFGVSGGVGRMVHRGRSRALAVRLELQTSHRGQKAWRCTALVWA